MKQQTINFTKELTIDNGKLFFYDDFITNEESNILFQKLIEETLWEQGTIKLYGKTHLEPRLRYWYGEKNYTYSSSILQANPLPSYLIPIKNRIETHSKTKFNSVLINYYRDGNDSMGWHQDNEKELGINPVIASLNLGETRMFHLRHISNKDLKTIKIPMTNGSLLIMSDETQHYWKHQIPKTKKTIKPRINLTFRYIH